MNAADKQKCIEAVRYLISMEAQLDNFVKRAAGAATEWVALSKADYFTKMTAPRQAAIKKLPAAMKKLAADGKLAKAEINKVFKASSEKEMAKYASGKDFRTKVLEKRLVPINKFNAKAQEFLTNLNAILDFNYPASDKVGPQAAVTALEGFKTYLTDMHTAVQAIK